MADKNRNSTRKARETADESLFRGMQHAIDQAHSQLWGRYFYEYAAICGNRTGARFTEKFDEAWQRSLLPNTERDDMSADGVYNWEQPQIRASA